MVPIAVRTNGDDGADCQAIAVMQVEKRSVRLVRVVDLVVIECPKCGAAFRAGFKGRNGLTPREVECAELVMCGFQNCEIAGKMHISEETVKRHMSNIFEKVGVDGRGQLIILGLLGREALKRMRGEK